MHLPIKNILWAGNRADHHDHLHVEGDPHIHRTLAECSSEWTPAIRTIYEALTNRFGTGAHYHVDPNSDWTHLGVYNCRPIANTKTPSQHAFSNAIDIGPYHGITEQQRFYDFLTGREDMPLNQIGRAVVDIAFKLGAQGDPTYWYGLEPNDPELENLRAAIRRGTVSGRNAEEIRKIIADAINNG